MVTVEPKGATDAVAASGSDWAGSRAAANMINYVGTQAENEKEHREHPRLQRCGAPRCQLVKAVSNHAGENSKLIVVHRVLCGCGVPQCLRCCGNPASRVQ